MHRRVDARGRLFQCFGDAAGLPFQPVPQPAEVSGVLQSFVGAGVGGIECAMPLLAVGIPEHPIPGVVRFVPVVPGVCAACAGELCVAGGCDSLVGVV